VTLFTRSPGKEQDARRLGADRIVLSTDAEQMKAVKNRFELIIDTVPYAHDLNPYLPTLALNGTLVLVGYLGDLEDMLNTLPLILGRKSVAGSVIGVRRGFGNRRYRRNPGNAGFLRPARDRLGYRAHQHARDQRRLRADAKKRCEIPLRDRYGLAAGLTLPFVRPVGTVAGKVENQRSLRRHVGPGR